MDNFSMNPQTEDSIEMELAEAISEYMPDRTKSLKSGINELAEYGKKVGLTTAAFRYVCEEAFVNASKEALDVFEYWGIESTEDFISFVVGFAFANNYKNFYSMKKGD